MEVEDPTDTEVRFSLSKTNGREVGFDPGQGKGAAGALAVLGANG